jgi:flagella basal body P-ring formation protein FlgA
MSDGAGNSWRALVMLGLVAALVSSARLHAAAADWPAAEAISRAVVVRMGDGAVVDVVTLVLHGGPADARFVDARPDPAARLGRPTRFTLRRAGGGVVIATATLRVTAEHVVAQHALSRGATVAAGDIRVVRGEVRDTPLRRLPTGEQVQGSRVLRPIVAGALILPGTVVVRRAIEAGDRVTAVAYAGDVQVSAAMTATDGGEPGDVIRVVNTDTRRSLRGRVVSEGVVEVGYAR